MGKKAGEGIVEFKLRKDQEATEMTIDEAAQAAIDFIQSELKRLAHDPEGDLV